MAKFRKIKLLAPMLLSSLLGLTLNSTGVLANDLEQMDNQATDQVEQVDISPEQTSDKQPSSELDLATILNQTAESELDWLADPQPVSKFEEPETDGADTSDTTDQHFFKGASDLSQVPEVWSQGYKGEGMVVAIIDSGLDIDHEVFKLTDVSTAKYKTKEDLEAVKDAAGITYGKWYNGKVIFAYNYAETNDNLKQSDPNSHGTHVASIAVGQETDYFSGVAPEAQLIFMRTSSDTSGARPLLYARAIEDAVKLGADVINLSLGSANGSAIDMSDHLIRAIEAARVQGVTVVIAAGNHGVYGQGMDNPYADYPDYAVIATPAVAPSSIAVASYNNTTLTREVLNIVGMEDNEALNGGAVFFTTHSNSTETFPEGEAYDYIYGGYGSRSEVRRLDMAGKILLVQRGGGVTFEDKIRYAQRYGAVGVVIFNNTDDQDPFVMEVDRDSIASYPSAFINKAVGEELLKEVGTGKYQIQFNKNMETVTNPDGQKMSSFSSWGLSADGNLKPDVAAPGGGIYAAVNDNKYTTADGTSMAAPHVAGIIALMKQALADQLTDLSPAQQEERLKQILMSTATPHWNEENQAYTSPRQQGAGLVNSQKAITSSLYLTGEDDLASISLGNVDEVFDFTVTIHNTSDHDQTVTYQVHLTTDEVENGRFTLNPRGLLTIEGSEIIVPAKGSLTLPISIDSSAFTQELSELMPNGYYLEGFVRVLSTDSDDLVSIPFLGFKGEFENLDVIEKPIYDFDLANGEMPYYHTPKSSSEVDQLDYKQSGDYTSLLTTTADYNYKSQQAGAATTIIAGTYKNDNQNNILERREDGSPLLLISPNADNNRDSLTLRATFLRNYTDLQASVYATDDLDLENPIWVSQTVSGTKNHYGDNPSNSLATLLSTTEWDGRDLNNLVVADGTYKYVISYYSAVPGAKEQQLVFDILVDTKSPIITTATYDEDSRTFTPQEILAQGSEIYRQSVFYYDTDGQTRITVSSDADGNYILPSQTGEGTELALNDFWFEVEDKAGNLAASSIAVLLQYENETDVVTDNFQDSDSQDIPDASSTDDLTQYGNETGFVTVNFQDIDSQDILDANIRYIIRDSDNNDVTNTSRIGRSSARTHALPFGDYTVELMLHDEDKAELLDDRLKTISLTADASRQTVLYDAKQRQYARFNLTFDTTPPAGTSVTVTDATGKVTTLPQSRYNSASFEQTLLTGAYTVTVSLPDGYMASADDLTYTVTSGQRNSLSLSLTAKGNLEENGGATSEDELPEFDFNDDHDGDGFSTAEELELGTDPFDADDYPQTAKGNLEENRATTSEDELPEFDFSDDREDDVVVEQETSISQMRTVSNQARGINQNLASSNQVIHIDKMQKLPLTISVRGDSLPQTGEQNHSILTIAGLFQLPLIFGLKKLRQIKIAKSSFK